MKQLNVAIIGQGRSGRDIHGLYLHTPEAQKLFRVVAIVDRLAERRARAKEEWNCPIFASYKDLFTFETPIDLVINSTFSYEHAPVTIDLLEHGFNVLCEKPACRTVAEFDLMCEAAQRAGRYLGIFQQSRFAPYYRQVRKIIDSGVLGRLIEVDIQFNGFSRRWDWQTMLAFNGGSLRNTGPHPLDQALDILHEPDVMPRVFCKMACVNTFGDAEDYVKLILTMPGKPLIDLSISCCDAYPSFTYKIHGENGGLIGNMKHIDWKYFDPHTAPKQHLIKEPLCQEDGTPAYCSEKLSFTEQSWDGDPNGAFDVAVASYYSMVYEHLVEGKDLIVTLPQVRQQVAVYEEAHLQNALKRKF